MRSGDRRRRHTFQRALKTFGPPVRRRLDSFIMLVALVDATSSNIYSRIVASAKEVGVPFLDLAAGLVAGQVVFVN